MPESTTSCAVNDLIARSKCYQQMCLGEIDNNAVVLFAQVANLAASGGTDYTNDLTALLNDAKEYQVLPKNQRRQINLLISLDNASDDGADISYDPNVLMAAAKCYACLGVELQFQLMLFLRCSLAKLDKPS